MEELPRLLKLLVQKSWGEGERFARWRWSPFFSLEKAIIIGRVIDV